jgi:two-component system sensor histidine kinase/response regulator
MKKRILLIEDEIELQQNLKEILEYHDFFVFTADNGIEALKIKDQKIDLILCDIMMPEMDGYQYLSVIRSMEKFKFIPFIFLSAKVGDDEKYKGLQAGADDYLAKPIPARLLLNSIFGALERKKENHDLSSLKHEKKFSIDHLLIGEEKGALMSELLNTLENLKIVTESLGKKEVSSLVKLALTSAQRIHASCYKLHMYKKLDKILPFRESVNLNDLIFEAINDLGGENFLFHPLSTHIVIFNYEQIRFIIRELLENSLNFKLNHVLVEVDLHENKLSIKNRQSIFGQNEEIQIEAFMGLNGEFQEGKGLGLGLFLSKKYCKINQAKLYCSVDEADKFLVQVFLPNPENFA